MIDRFVQRCHIVDIDADLWRQRESLAMTEAHAKPNKRSPEPPSKKR